MAVYRIAFQRASVGILILKKLKGRVRASSCWPRKSKLHPLALISKTTQPDRKIHLEKNLKGPLPQIPGLERTSENALQRDTQATSVNSVKKVPSGRKGGLPAYEDSYFIKFWGFKDKHNERGMILSMLL